MRFSFYTRNQKHSQGDANTESLLEKTEGLDEGQPAQGTSTETPSQSRASKALNSILSIPSTIWNSMKAVTYWAWKHGIQVTTSYPNGKKDAENLTAAKIFKQLVGFVTSTVAVTLARLVRLGIYVAAASVFFYAIFAIVATAPVSVPVAAGIAALTALTSAAVVSAVLTLATKSMWEEPSKAIDRNYYKFINVLVGNVDEDGKINKYGSGEELDALSKKSHKFGYDAADALLNTVSFVLSLPGRAINKMRGIEVDEKAVASDENVTGNVTSLSENFETTSSFVFEESKGLYPSQSLKRVNSQLTLRDLAAMNASEIVEGFSLVTERAKQQPAPSMV